MTLRRVYRALFVLLLALAAATSPLAAQAPRTITITAGDEMKFSLTEIKAKPGETLKIRLLAIGVAPRAAILIKSKNL